MGDSTLEELLDDLLSSDEESEVKQLVAMSDSASLCPEILCSQ